MDGTMMHAAEIRSTISAEPDANGPRITTPDCYCDDVDTPPSRCSVSPPDSAHTTAETAHASSSRTRRLVAASDSTAKNKYALRRRRRPDTTEARPPLTHNDDDRVVDDATTTETEFYLLCGHRQHRDPPATTRHDDCGSARSAVMTATTATSLDATCWLPRRQQGRKRFDAPGQAVLY